MTGSWDNSTTLWWDHGLIEYLYVVEFLMIYEFMQIRWYDQNINSFKIMGCCQLIWWQQLYTMYNFYFLLNLPFSKTVGQGLKCLLRYLYETQSLSILPHSPPTLPPQLPLPPPLPTSYYAHCHILLTLDELRLV